MRPYDPPQSGDGLAQVRSRCCFRYIAPEERRQPGARLGLPGDGQKVEQRLIFVQQLVGDRNAIARDFWCSQEGQA
jgi:hypothetical protein